MITHRASPYLFLLACFTVLLAACAPAAAAPLPDEIANRKINIVATTGMIADVVRNVGGERVQVTGLMGAGVDPHLYKASAGDVRFLSEADIVFYNGLHLEAGMAKVFERMNDAQKITVAVTERIPHDLLLSPPEFEGNYDPHVWFDVQLWMLAVEQVRDSLSALDPQHTEVYQRNTQAYLNQMAELDAYIREQVNRIPPEKRVLITAHDAFNYFSRAYGFEVRGLQGISTATEAGTADVVSLSRFIVERQIPAIFIETSVPLRNIEAVQAGVQAQGFSIRIGGELFSDAMGDAGTFEGTYLGMVRHNIDTIVNALSGE
jgi:manganese/zinc/iron transport system substrate-binding protein